MRSIQRFSLHAAFIAILALGSSAVSCRGAVATDPTADQVQQVRAKVVAASAATESGTRIIENVDDFVHTLPIGTPEKDTIGCHVLNITGSTEAPSETVTKACAAVGVTSLPQGPGPLHKALEEMKTVGSEPALRNTARAVLDLVRPLLEKMDASTNQAVKFAAMTIRTSLGYLTTL